MKHTPTPTPWRLGEPDFDGTPFIEILSDEVYGSKTIAQVQSDLNPENDQFELTPEVWANAEHIVRCVNSHDTLKDCVDDLMILLNGFLDKIIPMLEEIGADRESLSAAKIAAYAQVNKVKEALKAAGVE